jgi:hypothetical protein
MPKINGHGHVLILTDGAYVDGRMDLQKRETVKECTGGGPVGKPPMLKLNHCNLSSNVNNMNIEVRKRECTLIREVLLLYIGDSRLLAVCLHLMGLLCLDL